MYAHVTKLNTDNGVVVWRGTDGSGTGVFGQVLTIPVSGTPTKVGTEFQINSYTLNDQGYSASCAVSDDHFIVTWSSAGQDGSGYGIYSQLFKFQAGTSPTKVGSEFRVNTFNTGLQGSPTITAVNDGFMITWHTEFLDSSSFAVYGKLFQFLPDTQPRAIGEEFQINTFFQNGQLSPMIAKVGPTQVLVAWISESQGTTDNDIFGQLFKINMTNFPPITTTTAAPDDDSGSSGLSSGAKAAIGIFSAIGFLYVCCGAAKSRSGGGGSSGPSITPADREANETAEWAEYRAEQAKEETDRKARKSIVKELRALEHKGVTPGPHYYPDNSGDTADHNRAKKLNQSPRQNHGCD